MRVSFRTLREPKWFSAALIVLCCVPALLAIAAMASDIIVHTRYFGSNPVKEGEHYLGQWTLRFVIASLTVTPLRQITGWNWLAKHRRTIGLFVGGVRCELHDFVRWVALAAGGLAHLQPEPMQRLMWLVTLGCPLLLCASTFAYLRHAAPAPSRLLRAPGLLVGMGLSG